LPWTLASSPSELDANDGFIVASPLAPAADIEPLIALAANDAFLVTGSEWLYGVRAECKDLVMLPPATVVDSQPALDALLDELRKNHERAPRTAQLAMTS
jgi:hypothetical protein